MKKLLASLIVLASLQSFAQEEKKLVEDAVLDYVDGFYFGDTARLIRSISPQVIKYGYYRKKDATAYEGEPMSYREMLDYAISVKKRNNPNADKLAKKVEVLDFLDQTASAKLHACWVT